LSPGGVTLSGPSTGFSLAEASVFAAGLASALTPIFASVFASVFASAGVGATSFFAALLIGITAASFSVALRLASRSWSTP
jgi:hypothetical protein